MITIINGDNKHVISSTIFPDLTSQVWQLPEWVLEEPPTVVWNFEHEREIVDLYSLNLLTHFHELSIPYMPYARQDKFVSNYSTFNAHALFKLLDGLSYDFITSVDVHSPFFSECLQDFVNRDVEGFHKYVFDEVRPSFIVFPDAGAAKRYPYLKKFPHIIFEKVRDQASGEITKHKMVIPQNVERGASFLIVDDLCDGGATFASIAKTLHDSTEDLEIVLAVTHGLFTKGKEVLHASGIDNIFTTNSLLRNKEGFKVV